MAFFLTEAILLSLVAALVGLSLGQLSISVLQAVYPNFPVDLPDWGLLSALGVSILTGLLFGVLPARKAARLDPIAALAKR
jgi:putative ABC transport system permease protein